MPTVGLKKDLLFKALGKSYSDEEFANLCFEFGLELDEVTSEKQMLAKEQGSGKSQDASDEVIYRIDIPANRYDLLCLEGIARSLLIFQGKMTPPEFVLKSKPLNQLETLIIKENTKRIRPYAVAAILRNITFTADSYNSFIDLQDKLHQNICRKRSLVAIGTHDLDTVKGPFTYDALPPKDIKFKPLNQTEEFTGSGIMELYEHHAQLKQYLPIIRDSPVYPIIKDSNGIVLSLPPIINGDHTKIKLSTKNVFIECTATDKHKATVVLDTLVCMFSQYCAKPFHVEGVSIEYYDGKKTLTPKLNNRSMTINTESLESVAGFKLKPGDVEHLLTRMGLLTTLGTFKENGPKRSTIIPPTRHDILHVRDVVEDLAIAYGYNKIPKTIPKAYTVGKELPLNRLTDFLREEVARCGFTEALTFSLCSVDDISKKLGKDIKDIAAVHIANPKTLEFQVARTQLLPCLLKTVASNKKMPIPLRIFEVSDVVFADPAAEVGAKNIRHLAAVNYSRSAGFEIIHGLLDRVMQSLDVPHNSTKQGSGYHLRAADDSTYFPKRCAEVIYNGTVVGKLGVLHPNVLKEFELLLPCSAIELNVEPFL